MRTQAVKTQRALRTLLMWFCRKEKMIEKLSICVNHTTRYCHRMNKILLLTGLAQSWKKTNFQYFFFLQKFTQKVSNWALIHNFLRAKRTHQKKFFQTYSVSPESIFVLKDKESKKSRVPTLAVIVGKKNTRGRTKSRRKKALERQSCCC